MKKSAYLLALIVLMSCRKTYNCVCTNANGNTTIGTVTGTKKKAKKVCEEMISTNFSTCKIN
ncbi:MAG: hypothetical protein JNJ41_20015 [Bacteroidia bacterium]|nr:hypothetical protein [Bacteroidia bacterium]